MEIERIDHLVLTVRDVEATLAFYTRILGMREISFDGDRKALCFGEQKINLHPVGREIEPKAANATPGSADLCLVTPTPIEQVRRELQKNRVEVLLGPVTRTGAMGPMESIYFRDPDGNLLEISRYAEGS